MRYPQNWLIFTFILSAHSTICFDAADMIRKSIHPGDDITGIWKYGNNYDAHTITQLRCVNKCLNNFIDDTYQYLCNQEQRYQAKAEFHKQMKDATPLLGLCNELGEFCYLTRPKHLKGDDFFYAPITLFTGDTYGSFRMNTLYGGIAGFTLFQFIQANNLKLNMYSKKDDLFSVFSIELPNHPIFAESTDLNSHRKIVFRDITTTTINPRYDFSNYDHEKLLLIAGFYALYKKRSLVNQDISILVNPYCSLFQYNHATKTLSPLFLEWFLKYKIFLENSTLVLLEHNHHKKGFEFWHNLSKNNVDKWVEKNNILCLTTWTHFRAIDISPENCCEWSCVDYECNSNNWYIDTIVRIREKLFFSLTYDSKTDSSSSKEYRAYCITGDHKHHVYYNIEKNANIIVNPKDLQPILNENNYFDEIRIDENKIFLTESQLLFVVDQRIDPDTPIPQRLFDNFVLQYAMQHKSENTPHEATENITVVNTSQLTVNPAQAADAKNSHGNVESIMFMPKSVSERLWYGGYVLYKTMFTKNQDKGAQSSSYILTTTVMALANIVTQLAPTRIPLFNEVCAFGALGTLSMIVADINKHKAYPYYIGAQILSNVLVKSQYPAVRILAPLFWLGVDISLHALFPVPIKLVTS